MHWLNIIEKYTPLLIQYNQTIISLLSLYIHAAFIHTLQPYPLLVIAFFMKSRSKRNRKRPRGGVGCLVGGDDVDGPDADAKSLLQIETVPLSRAFDIISDTATNPNPKNSDDAKTANNDEQHPRHHMNRRVRIIQPYPYTFATFAKARWIGRTVVDIYHDEFGKTIDHYKFVNSNHSI